MKNRCLEVQERLLDLASPDLASHPDLARHLDSCPDCQGFWRAWQHLGPALRAADRAEPVDRGRIALAMARAEVLAAQRLEPDPGRPLARDLAPALLLGATILGAQVGCCSLWGLAGLAGLHALSALLLPLVVLGASRSDLGSRGGDDT